jgi:dienelactone hydrolase
MSAISTVSSAPKLLSRQAKRSVFFLSLFAIPALLLLTWNLPAKAEKDVDKDPPATETQIAPEKEAPAKPGADAKVPAAPADAKKTAASEKEKIPDPEEITLTTSDGVRLAMTYYPSNRGKEAIPVVLLHAWKGSRTDYKTLALALQAKGYTAIVPDLRGHGGSTKQKVGGNDYTLNAPKLPTDQYKLMVEKDMYAVKEFLWEKNNAKELNMNKLCVVGAEMGASVAINFTAFDAIGYGDSDRGPYYGPLQLGLFVKSLVLLSPEVSFKGLPLTPLPDELRKNLPVLILAGKQDTKSLDEAERVAKMFKRIPAKKDEDKTYFYKPLDTKLQGTKLLETKSLEVSDKLILPFLKLRLKDTDQAKEWEWKVLKKPHENG